MSTSSGRDERKFCTRCDHTLNEHARERDSKCKKCKKIFEICQTGLHGIEKSGAWKLCFIPCSCGKDYWPDLAKAAKPLEPHEYKIGHPGYRPLLYPEDEDGDDATHDDSQTDAGETEDSFTTPHKSSSSAAQSGRSRVDSAGSEDPLAWSPNTYQQRTGSMAGLVEDLTNTHIDDPGPQSKAAAGDTRREMSRISEWSDCYWSAEYKCEVRQRENAAIASGWEYEYRTADNSKGKAAQSRIGEWGDWYWSAEYTCEVRQRENAAIASGWQYEYRAANKSKGEATQSSKPSSRTQKQRKGKK
jgi:hypothetical protein